MGADQNVDAVDLMEGQPVNRLQPSRSRNLFWARAGEALGRESDPSRLSE
jgi:hypothetical protein